MAWHGVTRSAATAEVSRAALDSGTMSSDARRKDVVKRIPRLLDWTASTAGAVYSGIVTTVLTVMAYVVAYLAFQQQHLADPPTCEGIGFGCRPDPSTSLLFLAAFTAPILLAGLLSIAAGRVLAFRERPTRLRVIGAVMVVTPPTGALVGAGLAVLRLLATG